MRFRHRETVVIQLLDRAITEARLATEQAREVTEQVKVELELAQAETEAGEQDGGGRDD